MTTFRNLDYSHSNPDRTNIFACVADKAPEKGNWQEADPTILRNTTKLWRIAGVDYYGSL